MIFAKDKGRMCNNMLQYGHVYAWAREHGRRAVSMRFCYKYPYFSISHSPFHNFITYVSAKYLAKCGMLKTVTFYYPDEDTKAKEEAMLRHRNVVVAGWYVRFYDLFLKYKPDIVKLFAFDAAISRKVGQYAADASAGCDIRLGLHIRRGDYKTWNGGKYYYTDEDYAAMALGFAALHPGKRTCVFICGNDPALDKAAYLTRLDGMKVEFACGNAAEDLCLLSLCDYIIGPPSTFSLVASMYEDKPLCWVYDRAKPLAEGDFKHFDYLFKHIE